MEPGKDDVVSFAAQPRASLENHEVALSRNDAELRHARLRQSAYKAAVVISKLIQRRADAAQEWREPASHVRAAIGRCEHDKAAQPSRQILCKGKADNDPAHAVTDQVDAAQAIVVIEHLQQFG